MDIKYHWAMIAQVGRTHPDAHHVTEATEGSVRTRCGDYGREVHSFPRPPLNACGRCLKLESHA